MDGKEASDDGYDWHAISRWLVDDDKTRSNYYPDSDAEMKTALIKSIKPVIPSRKWSPQTEYVVVPGPDSTHGMHVKCVHDKDMEQYQCAVCLCLPSNPPYLLPCGHVFCRDCVGKQRAQTCALCRRPFGGTVEVKEAKEVKEVKRPTRQLKLAKDHWAKMMHLAVQCLHKSCSWTGTYGQWLKEHVLYDCPGVTVRCIWCRAACTRVEFHEHISSGPEGALCPEGLVHCTLCGLEVKRKLWVEHCHVGHPDVLVPCRCCTLKVLGQDMPHHRQVECRKVMVSCPYHFVGCVHHCQRARLHEHERSLEGHLLHLALAMQCVHKQRHELNEHTFVCSAWRAVWVQQSKATEIAEIKGKCPFHTVGCPFAGDAEAIQTHFLARDSVSVAAHLAFAARTFQQNKRRFEEHESRCLHRST